jgi:DNA adenine methylase
MSKKILEIKRPVLRYHGGKFILAAWIIKHFPHHRVYVDCFGGGGSVLMQKSRSYAEVYNDKWDTVVNVFQVLRDPAAALELERVLRLTPFSRTEFYKCGELDLQKVQDPIEKARLTIFRSFSGFGSASTNSKYATGFRANNNRAGTTPAHDWVNYPDHIKTFVERLRGVVIENKDYREVISQQDSPDTLIYADPPYVHSTRNMERGNAAYECEMDNADHVEMAAVLHQVKGMVVLSGYENDLYTDLFKDWMLVRKEAYADGAAKRVECLWINKRAASKLNHKLF